MRIRSATLRGDGGFTLVELLVTVTIIGILAAVVTVGVSGAASTAQTRANQALFNAVQGGADDWFASNATQTDVPTSGTPGAGVAGYYTATGATSYTTIAADRFVDFTSTAADAGGQQFLSFFRLNNSSATFRCVVGAASTTTLKACTN